MRADTAHSRLLGGELWHDATTLHKRLTYVPGDVTLWPTLFRSSGTSRRCIGRWVMERLSRGELAHEGGSRTAQCSTPLPSTMRTMC
jgi:hypothetical protein